VDASRGLAVLDQACEQFRQGMDLAKELGMRPLIARC
jgi:exonuclease VII small subunit